MMKQKKILTIRNIPNILTIGRIFLILPIVVLISLASNTNKIYQLSIGGIDTGPDVYLFTAGILFVIASISDFLDGYIARKYHVISEFGKLWDPIADKVLTNAVIICFIFQRYVPFWFLIISLTRDICVEGFRQYAIKKNIDVSAQKIGKWKTACQMIGFIIIFFLFNLEQSNHAKFNEQLLFWLGQNGIILISLILSVISGVMYFSKFYLGNKGKI